jgi:tRNA 2-thiouridine synthesizing protein A
MFFGFIIKNGDCDFYNILSTIIFVGKILEEKEVFQMADYKVTKTLDVMGEICPVPDVETKRALKKMKPGEILEVLIDYPLSKERIPETVKKMGDEVLEIKDAGTSQWKIYIKVK